VRFGLPDLGRLTEHFSNVIWAADTNYRIDLENDVVRALATSDEIDMLIAADQVSDFLSGGDNSLTRCSLELQ
jgi:synaptojanin